MKKHTVIKGASSGLGRAFAIAFFKRSNHLVLVALPNENLSEFTANLRKAYGVNIEYYEAKKSDRRCIFWQNNYSFRFGKLA